MPPRIRSATPSSGGLSSPMASREGTKDEDEQFELQSEDEFDELEEDQLDEDTPTPTGRNPMKLKLKFDQHPTVVRLSGRAKGSRAKKAKVQEEEEEEDEDEQDDEDEEDFSDTSSANNPAVNVRKTARQLAKEEGGKNTTLLELPNVILPSKFERETASMTAAEIALKREEISRKRKYQSDKRLEDEKTQTINKLLKKQASTRGRGRKSKLAMSHIGTPEEGVPVMRTRKLGPTALTWTSSIKSGEYTSSLGIGIVAIENGLSCKAEAAPNYPGPRPPPPTRRLK